MHFGLGRAQQAQQCGKFPRHGKDQVGKVVRSARRAPRSPVRRRPFRAGRRTIGRRPASACVRPRAISALFDAAAVVVGDQDRGVCRQVRPRCASRSRSIRRRGSASGSAATKRSISACVAGMQLLDDAAVALPQMRGAAAEGRAAEVADEQSGQRDVAPAQPAGAQAEIVLLAVALGEHVGAEQADGVQAVAAEVEAEADADRNIDYGRAVRACGQPVQPVGRRLVRPSDWCRPDRDSSGWWRRSTAG